MVRHTTSMKTCFWGSSPFCSARVLILVMKFRWSRFFSRVRMGRLVCVVRLSLCGARLRRARRQSPYEIA